MSTKGFLLLMVTVIIIGGAIGGAFSAGLALGRSQNDGALPETPLLQQRFGGAQPSFGGSAGGGSAGGGLPGGQLRGGASGGQGSALAGESQTGQHAPSGDGQGFRSGEDGHNLQGGFGGGTSARGALSGTIGAVNGNILTITTDSGESQVILGEGSTIQTHETGTAGNLSSGDRVLVVATGDLESGDPVEATLVIVNPPEEGATFGAGGFGGRGGFGGGASSRVILSGTIASVDGNTFTVTTDSGETQVTLGDDSAIQIYETVAAGDLSTGDRVLVIVTGDLESGAPVDAASVIVNPPEGAGIFGGGGFGGRPRSR